MDGPVKPDHDTWWEVERIVPQTPVTLRLDRRVHAVTVR